ncbi:Adenosine kinase [Solidesulfovibrio carbinoliphilus subsp. oakridgensis]|uniref:Adenosine kinase n=1 Tax=Solidesulfovibrio carbinoliphilus subsp. oakridgensis TaxID=694327 RepID=G7QCW9_9BACT|nr:carbohydrate kinase family protein [Solidesulfovibrio carbinoliphilus]EHJ46275.1 Adenosine kinase [Solidesulfovibrio carbinoliphilus subsp. oakridgensis]
MRILVSGSLAYDRIMSFPGSFADHILPDKIHILNVCFLVDGLEEKFGGTAGNIAYCLKLLGEDPTIVATAGKDFAAYEAWLRHCGIAITGIRRVNSEFTAGAYITTDRSDNQITGFNPGAMKHSAEYPVDDCDPADTLAIVAPGNLADMQDHPRRYKAKGIPVIVDPGQNITAFSGEQLTEMLTGATYLVSNDYELQLIENATKLTLAEIVARAGTVITTLGENGSVIRQGAAETVIPACPAADVKDPTGAGDAFRAGFIKGLSLGKTPVEAARIGSVSAAYAVEHHGTQEHRFTWPEFTARYAAAFGDL